MRALGELEPRPEEHEIVEPEVLRPGEPLRPKPPQPPAPAPLFFRALAAVVLAGAGLLSGAVGLVFTVSIVGAWIGVPLIGLGIVLLVTALAVLVGGGRFTVRRF